MTCNVNSLQVNYKAVEHVKFIELRYQFNFKINGMHAPCIALSNDMHRDTFTLFYWTNLCDKNKFVTYWDALSSVLIDMKHLH